MYESYKKILDNLKKDSLQRTLTPVSKEGKYIFVEGQKYLNLSSNDYLGIAENKEVLSVFFQNADCSMGSASSRLLTGNASIYCELEKLIASLYAKEGALIFNSGYHANVGIMSALLCKKDVVFSDKLNHASLIDGIKLSGADLYRYQHLNYEQLEAQLEKHRKDYENAIIITESLFSMDGDRANFEKLIELKKKYNAIFIVDEAHAFGVYGEKALGVGEEFKEDIDLIVGTFGKAIGSMGAFCVGSGVLIEYLTNKSRPLIFSTALPEINIAFSHYVIKEILPSYKEKRKLLLETAQKLRNKIKDKGLKTAGDSYIIPVILGTNEAAVECSNRLMNARYYLLPIRHPTVAPNSSRVRISLRADIDFCDVEELADIIKTCS